jgi:broad specificity phosphatase PhoE
MSSIVYLIRHGESISNFGLPSSCFSSIPLTPFGHEQSARLAEDWQEAPSLIVYSPFLRAQQTAYYLTKKFQHVPCETWRVEEFSFLNLSMLPPMTRLERKSLVDDYWTHFDPKEKQDGSESFEDFMGRVLAFQQQVELFKGDHLVVFTHGQFMKGYEYLKTFGFDKICSRGLMKDFYNWQASSPYANTYVLEYAITSDPV